MSRSLFFSLFWRIAAVLAAFAAVWKLVAGFGAVAAIIAGGLLAVWVAQWASRAVRREVEALRESVGSIVVGRVEVHPIGPTLRDFDRLAQTIDAAANGVRKALEASAESRHDLEALLDSMQDAIVAVDGAGRILWSNQRMQRLMLNASVSSVSSPVRVGHALVQTVRDPDLLEAVQLALESRGVSQRRATSVLPGNIFEVSASPMPGGGAVAVLHDITRIEEVERTQQDFVANVSHELRTPLTSISGYVETLLDHEPGLSATARAFLTTIQKNASRMNRLTEDLLVMARVESAQQPLSPSPQRADVLVRDAVMSLSGLVQENEAVLDVGELTQRQVFADYDAILQVLGNLIENAIKYGQTKHAVRSRVIVSAREIMEPYEAVEFRVQDFGQGIASEHLNRIFERFYRVDKARSRESGGTGLGLAIARHMIQTQGGTIRAESELNQGSTFIFTLPVAQYPVQPIS